MNVSDVLQTVLSVACDRRVTDATGVFDDHTISAYFLPSSITNKVTMADDIGGNSVNEEPKSTKPVEEEIELRDDKSIDDAEENDEGEEDEEDKGEDDEEGEGDEDGSGEESGDIDKDNFDEGGEDGDEDDSRSRVRVSTAADLVNVEDEVGGDKGRGDMEPDKSGEGGGT